MDAVRDFVDFEDDEEVASFEVSEGDEPVATALINESVPRMHSLMQSRAHLQRRPSTRSAHKLATHDPLALLQGTKSRGSRLRMDNECSKSTDHDRQQDDSAALKMMNESLEQEVQRLKTENGEMKSTNNQLTEEIATLRSQVVAQEEEQKETQSQIAKLESMVKELQMKTLDASKFMLWDWQQIHLWIMSLDGGRFEKYDDVLRKALSEGDFIGEDLKSVNALVLKCWGIQDVKDRERLGEHMQSLVLRDGLDGGVQVAVPQSFRENQNEGAAPTSYM